jgi:predicted nucleic acid-binding protein
MQLIVDANPVISILIKPGKPIDLLFVEELELVAPELLFEEIENNKELIVKKSGLIKEEIDKFIEILKKKIKVIPEEEFLKYKEEAERICPDEKDITYFALALYLKSPIWSNEKKLKEQNRIVVYATHELMDIFGID